MSFKDSLEAALLPASPQCPRFLCRELEELGLGCKGMKLLLGTPSKIITDPLLILPPTIEEETPEQESFKASVSVYEAVLERFCMQGLLEDSSLRCVIVVNEFEGRDEFAGTGREE